MISHIFVALSEKLNFNRNLIQYCVAPADFGNLIHNVVFQWNRPSVMSRDIVEPGTNSIDHP